MILTVTLNPAIDVTYHVAELVPGQTHRVATVDERLGGKGVNVASVLAHLGVPVLSTGLLNEASLPSTVWPVPEPAAPTTREPTRARGSRAATPASRFSPIAAMPRRTVVVTDGRDATGFWEPGPTVTPQEWESFLSLYTRLVPQAGVVVLSGSLPFGLPDTAYARLIEIARGFRVRSILDASGAALRHGLAAGPDVVKPNAVELADIAGFGHAGSPGTAARPVSVVGGPTLVVASHGADGLTCNGVRARLPKAIDGNATGAGDACVAALARGLIEDTPWPHVLRDAVALSAAAVAAPVAGVVDLELYERLRADVILEEY